MADPPDTVSAPPSDEPAFPPLPRDLAAMHAALEQARLAAERGEVPVGAVVYRLAQPGGPQSAKSDASRPPELPDPPQIIAVGYNLRESDADPTAHAEIVALRRAARVIGSWRLDGCGMAVTLEPCPMCAGALINSRIDELVYGCDDPKAGCIRTLYRLCEDRRFNHRPAVRAGVLAEPCAEVLRAFFASRR